jgi:hypothetical protein
VRHRTLIFLLVAALAAAAAAPGAAQAGPTLTGAQITYRDLADHGVKSAQRLWGNRRLHWYNDRLNDHARYPLATIWSIVPLFEAVDALAIADHSRAHKAAVRKFAAGAEKYYNRSMHGYGPYKGDRNRETVWFDDNGWWGMAFVDAWRATRNRRYLKDADRAFRFVVRYGWAPGGGIWWNTRHPYRAGEALASDTLLGARLYAATHNRFYLQRTQRFIAWGDTGMPGRGGMYGIRDGDSSPVSYVEGPMIEAHQVLCDATGNSAYCQRAEQLADAAYNWFGPDLDQGPQFDTIHLRSMLYLYSRDQDRRWYDLAVTNARRAQENAQTGNGLYLAAWDGGPITGHQARPNMLQTHAATVELFAWLAATPPPGYVASRAGR